MDATYSNSLMTCATAEVTRFAVHTPPINLIINRLALPARLMTPIWALPLGALCAGLVMPFLCV